MTNNAEAIAIVQGMIDGLADQIESDGWNGVMDSSATNEKHILEGVIAKLSEGAKPEVSYSFGDEVTFKNASNQIVTGTVVYAYKDKTHVVVSYKSKEITLHVKHVRLAV